MTQLAPAPSTSTTTAGGPRRPGRAWLSWRLFAVLALALAVAGAIVPGALIRSTPASAAPASMAVKPDTVKPDTVKPDIVKPDTVKPETAKRESAVTAKNATGTELKRGAVPAAAPVPAVAGVKPRTVPSYYVTFTDPGRGYDLGCQQGRADAPLGRVDTTVALLFGGQNAENTGTQEVRGPAVSYEQIAKISQAFARGYWTCTGDNDSARLFLSVATNNSGWSTSRAGGVAWGNLVNKIKAHVVGNYGQVVVLGGNDIEPAWNSYDASAAWVDGYSSVAWQMFLNMPSAEGCPIDTATGGACDNGWTQRDVWWLSYGHPMALAAPQIYYGVNAQQWRMIAQYGASQGKPSRYMAAMDQYPADPTTLDAGSSWGALQDAMNAYPSTASAVPFSMEITYS